jgi:hypothetical protein
MKDLKRATVLLMAVLAMLLAPKTTAAEIYVGDYCWNVYAIYGPTYLLKMEIHVKDGGDYAFNGTLTRDSSVVALNANAEIVGNEVLVTGLEPAVSSRVDAGRTGLLDHTFIALLDKSTLHGTYYVKTGVNTHMAFIACP